MNDRLTSSSTTASNDARFDLIRVIACLAVILLHVSARGIYLFIQGEVSHKWWLIAVGVNSATRWCVPVFVMLSGALLLRKPHSWKETYFRRLPRMALVLAVAAAIYTLWQIYFTKDLTLRSFLDGLYYGQPYYHLYFFFVIMGLYAILPVLSRLFSQIDQTTTLWATCIACLITSISFTLSGSSATFITFAVPYIGYFAFGYYLSRYQPRLPYRWIMVAAYAVTFAAVELATLVKGANWPRTLFPHTYFAPNTFVFAIGVFGTLYEMRPNARAATALAFLAPLTLIAYIIHPMIMETIRWVFATQFPTLTRLKYDLPVVYTLTVCFSFLAAFCLKEIPIVRRYF